MHLGVWAGKQVVCDASSDTPIPPSTTAPCVPVQAKTSKANIRAVCVILDAFHFPLPHNLEAPQHAASAASPAPAPAAAAAVGALGDGDSVQGTWAVLPSIPVCVIAYVPHAS